MTLLLALIVAVWLVMPTEPPATLEAQIDFDLRTARQQADDILEETSARMHRLTETNAFFFDQGSGWRL